MYLDRLNLKCARSAAVQLTAAGSARRHIGRCTNLFVDLVPPHQLLLALCDFDSTLKWLRLCYRACPSDRQLPHFSIYPTVCVLSRSACYRASLSSPGAIATEHRLSFTATHSYFSACVLFTSNCYRALPSSLVPPICSSPDEQKTLFGVHAQVSYIYIYIYIIYIYKLYIIYD